MKAAAYTVWMSKACTSDVVIGTTEAFFSSQQLSWPNCGK